MSDATMDRDEQLELLSAYADGELDDEELEIVERLLKSDKDVAFESTQILNMKRLIQRWDGVEGKGRLRKAVLSQVAATQPKGSSSGLVSFLMGIMAALLLLAGGFFLFQYLGGEAWIQAKAQEWAQDLPGGSPSPSGPAARRGRATSGPGASTVTLGGLEGSAPVVSPAGTAEEGAWAELTRVKGSVTVVDRARRAAPAQAGRMLRPGQSLTTGQKAHADVRLPAGGLLRLLGRSHLEFRQPAQGVQLVRGTLLTHFPSDGPATGMLVVRVDDHRVQIPYRDCRALVSRETNGTLRVALLRGRVTLVPRGKNAKTRILTAGKSLTLKPDGTYIGPLFYQRGAEFGDFGVKPGKP